ncbi:VIT family protein [Paraglaciecola sp. L1A13]|uniref:VIT1/CCC1 transporter family protein n=1 Tax=Paraglaciecola sp. L1A13 TaxID=2686359 RepID=UPI00131E6344|nr:VIT family protein [Paraglaciecola sp. L1A13]
MSDEKQVNEHTRSLVVTRLSWLRAGVLGANDGLISTAGLVVGVAAASADIQDITTAGIAGLTAGAISMALGEYVSVSTQRDTETALIAKKRSLLKAHPDEGKEWIASFLRERGVSAKTASLVIEEFRDGEVLRALIRHGFGINEQEIANPWVAAGSSLLSFSFGAALPVIAMLLSPTDLRIQVTFIGVLIGLALTGGLSAYLGQSSKRSAVIRLLVGGALAMATTYGIGQLLGTTAF